MVAPAFVPFKLDYGPYRIVKQRDRFVISLRGSVTLPAWTGDVPAPDTLYWPDNKDLDGAKRLVDMVIAADLPKIRDLGVLFPNFNFGVGMLVQLLDRAAQRIRDTHGVNPVDEIGVAVKQYPEPVGSRAKIKYPLSKWDMIGGMRGEVIYYLWDDERRTQSVRINIWADVAGRPTILSRIGSSLDGRIVAVVEDHPGRYRALGLSREPLERLLVRTRSGTLGKPCSPPKVSPLPMLPSRLPAHLRSETSPSSSSSFATGG
jgi:hypothetical protein